MHLVRRCYFQSRDKDGGGGHTVRSAISNNSTLHANCTVLSSVEPQLLPIELLRCGNREFRAFCSSDLDLVPMIYKYDLDQYPLMCTRKPNMNFCVKAFESYRGSTATLRSASRPLLHVPQTPTVYGSRAFSVAAPTLWNSLPADITNAASLTAFRNRLKTFLFHRTPSGCLAD